MNMEECNFRVILALSNHGVVEMADGKKYYFPHHHYINPDKFNETGSITTYYCLKAQEWLHETVYKGEPKSIKNLAYSKRIYIFHHRPASYLTK
ncbi:MAG: hypothetical protein AB2L22_12825 [Syntrophales bacterium]